MRLRSKRGAGSVHTVSAIGVLSCDADDCVRAYITLMFKAVRLTVYFIMTRTHPIEGNQDGLRTLEKEDLALVLVL